MNFIAPDWLYFLIVPCLLIPLLAAVGAVKRKKRLALLLGANADSPEAVRLSRTRRFWRIFLLGLTLLFAVIACARPFFDAKLLPFTGKGRDLLVLCDVSRSMNASDIAPSRLHHARYLLNQLAEKCPDDRFGLIPFAGNAYLSCPLTSDPVTFKEYVDELSTDSVPAGGTNLERALNTALKAFAGAESGSCGIVLLTDGEELQGNIKPVIAELAKRKIPVFAVGFGDPVKGAVIPVEPGKAALVRDRSGKIVTSKLNEKLLSSLASATGGSYYRTSVTDQGAETLAAAIGKLERNSREQLNSRIPVDEFPKVIAAALVTLLCFLLLSERRTGSAAALLISGLLCMGAGVPGKAELKTDGSTARPPLPEDPYELYNLARRFQIEKKGEFEEIYRKLIASHAENLPLRRACFNNLGVSFHSRCRSEAAAARKEVQGGKLQEALKTVSNALQTAAGAEELYSSSAEGAKTPSRPLAANLDLLAKERKALEELKKKIEELLKQQQKAADQSRSAQQQNRSKPQDQQQRRKQQESIDKAKQESQKLEKQARDMKQSSLEDSAKKASEELEKASQAKKQGRDKESSKHIDNAVKELERAQKKNAPQKEGEKGKEQQQQQQEPKEGKNQQPPPSGSPQKVENDRNDRRKGAEQMLELMGEDDKKLRSAIKKQMRMNRPQTDKDW